MIQWVNIFLSGRFFLSLQGKQLYAMPIITITNPQSGLLNPYMRLTDTQLRNRLNPAEGIIIVESPKVITTAIDSGFTPLSLLAEAKHLNGDASPIADRLLAMGLPVYTGSRELLAGITGYTLTRGVLCAMRRPADADFNTMVTNGKRLAVLHGISDATNIGAIVRSAAALDMDGIILSGGACDVWNRRAIRVSMGGVFKIPICRALDNAQSIPSLLRTMGMECVALALRNDSLRLDSPELQQARRLAIVLGEEGYGLPQQIISDCRYTATIPMARGIDSLNVAAAAAIAFFALQPR